MRRFPLLPRWHEKNQNEPQPLPLYIEKPMMPPAPKKEPEKEERGVIIIEIL